MMTTAEPHVLAVDIGGTKMAAALVDESGRVLTHHEVRTPVAPAGAAGLVAGVLADLVRQTVEGHRPIAAAVASAGPLDPAAGVVSPVNIPAWRDFPVVACVAAAAGGLPTVLLGDATAAAIGEQWRGAGTDSAALLGIVVSTGIGGGLVLGGEPFCGPTGNAGHIGHIYADPYMELCPCGARGCVETAASGPAMVRYARRAGWVGPDARALAEAARAGDAVARGAFARAADALAGGVLAAATLCDLDVVVVGGGVSAAGEVLLGPMRDRIAQRAKLSFVHRLQVRQAALGRRAGLIGAARFALHTDIPTLIPAT
jgi:glucokinase